MPLDAWAIPARIDTNIGAKAGEILDPRIQEHPGQAKLDLLVASWSGNAWADE